MQIKTSELTGHALNWAVGVAQGVQWESDDPDVGLYHRRANGSRYVVVPLDYATMEDWSLELYAPSAHWSQGGPIIEREGISLTSYLAEEDPYWIGSVECQYKNFNATAYYEEYGPTPLIAAMRCYVASKLGDTVDVPDELLINP